MIGLAALASLLVLGRSGTRERTKASRWLLIGLSGAIIVDVALLLLYARAGLRPYSAHLQDNAFLWPAIVTAVALLLLGLLVWLDRNSIGAAWRQRGFRGLTFGVVGLLLASQTAFLVIDDAPIPTPSTTEYASTPAVLALQRAVGSSLVGLGSATRLFGGLDLGFAPDNNLPFGIHEIRRIRSHHPFELLHHVDFHQWFLAWNTR